MNDYKWQRILAGAKRRTMVLCRRAPRPWRLLFRVSSVRTELWVGRRIITIKIPGKKRRVFVNSAVAFGPTLTEVYYNV